MRHPGPMAVERSR